MVEIGNPFISRASTYLARFNRAARRNDEREFAFTVVFSAYPPPPHPIVGAPTSVNGTCVLESTPSTSFSNVADTRSYETARRFSQMSFGYQIS